MKNRLFALSVLLCTALAAGAQQWEFRPRSSVIEPVQASQGAEQQCRRSPLYGQCRASELSQCCYGWYEWRNKSGFLYQECGYRSPTANFGGDRIPGYVACSPAGPSGAAR